jgi:hypothetical protein
MKVDMRPLADLKPYAGNPRINDHAVEAGFVHDGVSAQVQEIEKHVADGQGRFAPEPMAPNKSISEEEPMDDQDSQALSNYPTGTFGWLENEIKRRDQSGAALADLYSLPGVNVLEALAHEWWRRSLSPRTIYRLGCEYFFSAGTEDLDYHQMPIETVAATLWARKETPPPRIPAGLKANAYLEAVNIVNTSAFGANTRQAGRAEIQGPAAAAFKIIKRLNGKGISGKELIKELKEKGVEIGLPTFQKHVVPILKQHGVRNSKALGGYFYDELR